MKKMLYHGMKKNLSIERNSIISTMKYFAVLWWESFDRNLEWRVPYPWTHVVLGTTNKQKVLQGTLFILPIYARKDFRTAVSFPWHNHWLWSLPSEKSGYPEALRWCHKVEQEGKRCRSGGASGAPGARVISAHSFVCPDQGCETEIPATVHGNAPKEPEEKPSSSGIK